VGLHNFQSFCFVFSTNGYVPKAPNSVSWNIRTGICGQEVGILFTCINTSFDSLSTQKLLFLIYRGFCGRVSSVQKLIHLKPACGLGVGLGGVERSESSVHVGQSRRFTRLLLYRRLQFVSSLQNNFRMTFPILPLSHIYLWLKWSWISRAEDGKDSLFERGCAHVCAAFGFCDVASKGTRRLFSHLLASWKQTAHFHYHSLRHTWTMFSTLNTNLSLQMCITHCAS